MTSKTIEQAFLAFQENMGAVTKKGVNPFHKSSYPRYEDVIASVGHKLNENGLTYRHTSRVTPDGLYIGTKLIHAETGTQTEPFEMLCPYGKMQEMGSAITYCKRYTMTALLGLPSEDDDGNKADNKSNNKSDDQAKPIFDPDNINHAAKLEEALKKRGIPSSQWHEIAKKMTGKAFKELDNILGVK